ncbi:MAG: hypothetical protein P0S94_00025 [Simkaniaceae bacterium]|nr:hypothetical protein [Simkaniaceae bacterium]
MESLVYFKEFAITYRVEDIKEVGVSAYLRGLADWFFNVSCQHVAVNGGPYDYQCEGHFVAKLTEVNCAVWFVQRVVYLIALPILLAAKFACDRGEFCINVPLYGYCSYKGGFTDNERREITIAPDQTITLRSSRDHNWTITNEDGKLAEKSEIRGHYSKGEYDEQNRLIDGKLYNAHRGLLREGKFEYRNDETVWFTKKGDVDEVAVLIEKTADGVIYRGIFNDDGNLVRGEMIESVKGYYKTIVNKGEFKTDDQGCTYLTKGIRDKITSVVDKMSDLEMGFFRLGTDGNCLEEGVSRGKTRQGDSLQFSLSYGDYRFSSMERVITGGDINNALILDGYRYEIGFYSEIANFSDLLEAQYGILPDIKISKNQMALCKTKENEEQFDEFMGDIYKFAAEVFAYDKSIPDFATAIGKMKLQLVKEVCKFTDEVPGLSQEVWKHILTYYVDKSGENKVTLTDEQLNKLAAEFPGMLNDEIEALRSKAVV